MITKHPIDTSKDKPTLKELAEAHGFFLEFDPIGDGLILRRRGFLLCPIAAANANEVIELLGLFPVPLFGAAK